MCVEGEQQSHFAGILNKKGPKVTIDISVRRVGVTFLFLMHLDYYVFFYWEHATLSNLCVNSIGQADHRNYFSKNYPTITI